MKDIFTRTRVNILVVLFIIFLIIGYVYFVGRESYPLVSINYIPFIIVLFIAYLPSSWLPLVSLKPSMFLVWTLYLVVYIPTIIIPFLSIEDSFATHLPYNLVLLFCFLILSRLKYNFFYEVKFVKIKWSSFLFLFFCVYGYLTYRLISIFGFNLSFVSLLDVYEVRASYKETMIDESFIGIRWLLYIFNPFLIIVGYIDKSKRVLLFFGFVGELMIYSVGGFKTALFIGFIIVVFLYFAKRTGLLNRISILLLYATVGVFIISMVGDLVFFQKDDSYKNILSSLTIRRNFVVPGFLSGHYYDYFSQHSKAYMANHKIFGALVDYDSEYKETIQTVIGQHVFGRHELNANVNIWADSYANYGLLGVVVTTLVLFLFLLIYDNVSSGIDLKLSFTLLIGPLAFFSNSAMFTSLIGHGAIWVLILVYFYNSLMKSLKNE